MVIRFEYIYFFDLKVKNYDVCDVIDDARIEMFFLVQDIEAAYDKKKDLLFVSPISVQDAAQSTRPDDIEQETSWMHENIQRTAFKTRENIPSFKILLLHSMKAMETATKKRLTVEQKKDLYTIIQVISPEPLPSKGSVHA